MYLLHEFLEGNSHVGVALDVLVRLMSTNDQGPGVVSIYRNRWKLAPVVRYGHKAAAPHGQHIMSTQVYRAFIMFIRE